MRTRTWYFENRKHFFSIFRSWQCTMIVQWLYKIVQLYYCTGNFYLFWKLFTGLRLNRGTTPAGTRQRKFALINTVTFPLNQWSLMKPPTSLRAFSRTGGEPSWVWTTSLAMSLASVKSWALQTIHIFSTVQVCWRRAVEVPLLILFRSQSFKLLLFFFWVFGCGVKITGFR